MTTYVCDTSVLLHSPTAIYSFAGSDVVIPMTAFEEMDDKKGKKNGMAAYAGRQNIKLLDKPIDVDQDCITLENDTRITIEMNNEWELPQEFDKEKPDNKIINVAMNLIRSGRDVVFVSNDAGARVKAKRLGIPAESLDEDRVDIDPDSIYKGTAEAFVSNGKMGEFAGNGEIKIEGDIVNPLLPNQYVKLININNPRSTMIGKVAKQLPNHKYLIKKLYNNIRPWGLTARNLEQEYAIDALMDDSIKVVTLIGGAGTGKTLMSIAAGGEQVIERKDYNRMLIYKPFIPMGKGIGFLPGEVQDKIGPWMGSIKDSFEYLLGDLDNLTELMDQTNKIELGALTFIRGRSLPKLYIVIDEAQNLTPHEVKTIVTRAGENTKLIFTGDPHQIDNPYLDAQNNGLIYLTEKFKGEELFASITLTKTERSEVADLGIKLL